MAKSADAQSPKRAQPEAKLEPMAPAASGGFAAVPARRAAPLQPDLKAAPLITGGETTQYQVPLDLLVLARNKEKDKARSVAVTPVAPKPDSDEPPPSNELSDLPAAEPSGAAPAVSGPAPAATPLPSPAPLAEPRLESLPGAPLAPAPVSSARNTLALLALIVLCLCAGYYAVELMQLF